MDIEKILKKVESLSDYISITQDVPRKYKNSKIQFNMSTVLSLKKVRFLEVEYFNKYKGHGAAFIILERVLELPGSKTWGLLGKELVALLQHWLDSARKHLIVLNESWWTFMNMLLKFIKELRLKDSTLPDLLVESTAEQLLDVATRSEPDSLQRQHILYCLNLCCADSSREVRFATRHRLDGYFVKLSCLLATSGHAPAQFAMLETLLRWLLPRQNAAVRRAAALAWFPESLFRKQVVDIFLERPWQNFPQDARDFLNAHNISKNLVTSVVFRRMTIGDVNVDCSDRRDSWLDINPASKSITVLLDGRMMQALSVPGATLQSLMVLDENLSLLQLARESSDLTLLMKTSRPVHVYPSEQTLGDGDIAFVVSSRNDLKKLDVALREVFGAKYEVLVDIAALTASPADRNVRIADSSEEDTRFSHPVRPSRRKASGYMTKSAGSTFNSPSTTSTTSLALLQDRLRALPKFRFNKEPLKISVSPDTNKLPDITEIDDSQSIASSTGRNRTFGFYKSFRQSEKQSQSDGEKYKSSKKYISPIIGVKEHDVSCLLVATVGPDEAVINETIESLSKNKDNRRDNIVDLLLQEALQSKDDKLDSGIQTGENIKKPDLRDSDAIENTPEAEHIKFFKNRKEVDTEVISEESNEIDETPFEYVSVRKKVIIDKRKQIEQDLQKHTDINDMQAFDQEAVEKFFSQHITENTTGGIVVSPTLARKINETSSEASDNFKDCLVEEFLNVQEIQEVEIIDCLNHILDKVCLEFGKCAEILEKDNTEMELGESKMAENKEAGLEENVQKRILDSIENINSENKKDIETPKKRTKQKKAIKLKFNTKKTLNKSRVQKREKLEPACKMSPIPENKDSVEPEIVKENVGPGRDAQVTEEIENPPQTIKKNNKQQAEIIEAPVIETATGGSSENISPKSSDLNMPLIRRRRKLYSPKDDNGKSDIQIETPKKKNTEVHILQEDDIADFKSDSKKTPKSVATCYKDIEKERKRIRLPNSRKSKGKEQATPPSPRTKKMNDVFDNLKATVEKTDDIFLADKKSSERDLAIYNFTSDSEDEDFKKKKVEIRKRISTTTNASCDSATSRHGRLINKVNYSEKSSDEKSRKPKTKNVVRRKRSKRKPHNLADQKMRNAQKEDLNTSIVFQKENEVEKDPELILEAPPQMEVVGSKLGEPSKSIPRKKIVKKVNVKKEKILKKHIFDYKLDFEDRTLSPLPGLIIEKVSARKDDLNDSVSTQVINKLKKMYHEGPEAVDELNTTQNLLLDVDKVDFSQHLNITNEFEKAACDISNVTERNTQEAKSKPRKNNAILNDDENVIEVITFEENNGKQSSGNDIIDISISDVQSEKSIATVGKSPITAHGDLEEEPPDNRQLIKRVQSRNMDIEDMDTSMKDYYLRLQEEINKPIQQSSSDSSKLEIDLKKTTEKRSQKCISPVESIRKMSGKALSPKNDSSQEKVDLVGKKSKNLRKSVSPDISQNKTSYEVIEEWMPSKNNKAKIDLVDKNSDISSRHSISPVVSLHKMSYDDISKWLPSRRNSYDSSGQSSEKSVIIEKVKEKAGDVSEKATFLRPRPKDLHSNVSTVSCKRAEVASSPQNSDKKIIKEKLPKSDPKKIIKLQYDLRSTTKSVSSIKRIEIDPTDCKNNDQNSIKTSRKSLISPIKLFDEPENLLGIKLQKYNDAISQISKKSEKTNKKREVKSPILNISVCSNNKLNDIEKAVDISSGESRISSSTRVDGKVSVRSVLKRKSESPVKEYGKNRRVEVLTDSGPSVSSIDNWFKRSAPISAVESLSASYGDSLQNIMEKLDTTLTEIHQNTSKNFLHMFVDAQRQLTELKNERRRSLKQVATDVLKEVVHVLDTKFADLEKRTQEMDTEFMEQLKSRATELVREDCKKKRVMVALLQDDVKAVLGHLRRDRDSSQ